MSKKTGGWLIALVIAFGLVFLGVQAYRAPGATAAATAPVPAQATQTTESSPTPLSYNDVLKLLQNDPTEVTKVTFEKDASGNIQDVIVERKGQKPQTVGVPGEAGATAILNVATSNGVRVETQQASSQSGGMAILNLLLSFGLPILLIFFLFRMMRGAGGGGINNATKFGQSGAQKFEPSAGKKTFADVAGCDEAKRELQEVIDYLRDPGMLATLGGHPPKGVLLVGSPGNGKTLLAKAVAGEANAVFFSIPASNFVEMFVGVGASRVRDLFNQARGNKPAVVFIDEIDAVGRQRGAGLGGGNDEREQTLNQLLVEMDGFTANDGVILMAATNRPDILDPALVRPGRFDLQVLVDFADVTGRYAILKVHTRNKPLANPDDLQVIAQNTPGFSGAELEGVANQAATVAARRIKIARAKLVSEGKSTAEAAEAVPLKITLQDLDEGVDRVKMGPAKDGMAAGMSDEQKAQTAYHELGHAYVSQVMYNEGKGGDPVTKITCMPRARALGYTMALPKGDRLNWTDKEIKARIMMAMGGRVAQEVFLETVDTGASNDFEQATNWAKQMVMKWGMTDLGHISVGESSGGPFLGRSMATDSSISPWLHGEIDQRWIKIVEECYTETRKIIERDKACFKKIADILLAQETILGPQWEQLFNESTCREKKIPERKQIVLPEDTCQTCGHEPKADEDPGLLDKLADKIPGAKQLLSHLPGKGKKRDEK